MREVQVHEIAGVKYTITQLGAKQGRSVLSRLIKCFGPAAGAKEPVAALAASLNDADLEFLCDAFAKSTRFAPTEETEFLLSDRFDDHFAGQYGSMLKWLWACIQANYSNFLGELGLDPKDLAAKAMAKATTTTPATGLFGASSPKATGV